MLTVKNKGFDESIYTEKIEKILDLPKGLEELALAEGVKLEAALEVIYATAPPRDSSKFVWSLDPAKNKKASGWWWYNLKKGNIPTNGRHYARKGKPPYGVKIELMTAQKAVSFQVKMSDPKMRFPFGGLNGVDTRNPTHKQTGWVFASPLVNNALEDARNGLIEAMALQMEGI